MKAWQQPAARIHRYLGCVTFSQPEDLELALRDDDVRRAVLRVRGLSLYCRPADLERLLARLQRLGLWYMRERAEKVERGCSAP